MNSSCDEESEDLISNLSPRTSETYDVADMGLGLTATASSSRVRLSKSSPDAMPSPYPINAGNDVVFGTNGRQHEEEDFQDTMKFLNFDDLDPSRKEDNSARIKSVLPMRQRDSASAGDVGVESFFVAPAPVTTFVNDLGSVKLPAQKSVLPADIRCSEKENAMLEDTHQKEDNELSPPCCANPQSPATSEHGSPRNLKQVWGSHAEALRNSPLMVTSEGTGRLYPNQQETSRNIMKAGVAAKMNVASSAISRAVSKDSSHLSSESRTPKPIELGGKFVDDAKVLETAKRNGFSLPLPLNKSPRLARNRDTRTVLSSHVEVTKLLASESEERVELLSSKSSSSTNGSVNWNAANRELERISTDSPQKWKYESRKISSTQSDEIAQRKSEDERSADTTTKLRETIVPHAESASKARRMPLRPNNIVGQKRDHSSGVKGRQEEEWKTDTLSVDSHDCTTEKRNASGCVKDAGTIETALGSSSSWTSCSVSEEATIEPPQTHIESQRVDDKKRGCKGTQGMNLFSSSGGLKNSHGRSCGNARRDYVDMVDDLYSRYPCRETQIRSLLSLMGTSVRRALRRSEKFNNDVAHVHVPAPIFVSGPSATGKTSVVMDVINTLKGLDDSSGGTLQRVRSALVDCATLEQTSIESVMDQALIQLTNATFKRTQKRKNHEGDTRMRTRQWKSCEEAEAVGVPTKFIEHGNESLSLMDCATPLEYGSYTEDEAEAERKSMLLGGESEKAPERKNADAEENGKNGCVVQSGVVVGKSSSHAYPVAFGRALSRSFGEENSVTPQPEQSLCGFLVIDNAERLLGLSPSKSRRGERNNFLSQLLHVPRVLGLNVTVIVISRSNLLSFSRSNNVVPVRKGLGTINDVIRPIRVHFSSYVDKTSLKEILKKPRMKRLMIGLHSAEELLPHELNRKQRFHNRLFDSFLDTLMQCVLSSARDLRDMIRLGRLWPYYVDPLHPDQMEATMRLIRKQLCGRENVDLTCRTSYSASEDSDIVQNEILAFLDKRVLSRFRSWLEYGGDHPCCDRPLKKPRSEKRLSSHDLPYLSKCFLLAAFVCQRNGADNDRKLFTIDQSGKPSKKRKHFGSRLGEDVAHGSGSWDQQRNVPCPKSFPLERMISVFVNITGLLEGGSDLLHSRQGLNSHHPVEILGTDWLFDSLAELRKYGLIREVGGSTGRTGKSWLSIDLNCTQYSCLLTPREAEKLATSINFPISKYLI